MLTERLAHARRSRWLLLIEIPVYVCIGWLAYKYIAGKSYPHVRLDLTTLLFIAAGIIVIAFNIVQKTMLSRLSAETRSTIRPLTGLKLIRQKYFETHGSDSLYALSRLLLPLFVLVALLWFVTLALTNR